ncbi:hypothetical protein A2662_02620 [Candidatus Giovannonibacteria bacterium RIFCSPHIGHO2_01_FULL_45_33]|uniref:Uncharacterized protein n=1 Tax=Candidatus Giovannonibacteria bacterium RIFCSPLOWO2_01_FULL_45_34 TaxID=1798351 RepID=A0A1F5WYM3_9BACT|nr:MAG: hypothetical protein A2662_02620 [Candidatus Giovannonibacteria bacterium RIFCSPHIGHO2_01_FULL_45_33]OGF70974.1 MAG: hypothetical protein A3C73_04080 [Candidatus Giovannonibacteria bacterium RIFCSPHIGHO2_02_FULL_44_11]OGF80693.1 MAG: hypothetical protein A2930_01845 [Candidatus Giovannonibacteria bacterium RIFCSPLOWO2_01_FULL_45_34]
MRPSDTLTETQRKTAIDRAAFTLKQLSEIPSLKELRADQVLASKKDNWRDTLKILGAFGFGGKSFDTKTLLLTQNGIVEHHEHTDGYKTGGHPMAPIGASYGITRLIRHKIVVEEKFKEIVETYNLDDSTLENLLRRFEKLT